jgi:hypothetical protein
LNDSLEIAHISREANSYISLQEKPFDELPQDLVKNKRGLYVFLNGSGRLYKVIKNEKGVDFNRLDTTRYLGYNGGCFTFSYRDTIYNLGGYGLWRINGQLRAYVERTKQWDIVKLNHEIPIMFGKDNTLLWFDRREGKIYTGISIVRDEAVKDTGLNEAKFIYDVSVLDLSTKDWKKLGYLGSFLRNEIPNFTNITSSPWGQLIFSGNKWMLVDFKRNRLLTLNASKQQQITSALAPHIASNSFYFRDSVLYAANSRSGRIDSFQLSKTDFIATNEVVFEVFTETAHPGGPGNYIFMVLAVILAGTILWWAILQRRRKRLNMEQDNTNSKFIQKEYGIHPIVFEERELEVLKLIYVNSASAKSTTIEEINKTLGIAKRNNEIQKKQRSDVITSINRKYHYIFPDTEVILDKKRSDYDKRSFEYFIKFDLLSDVSNLLERISLARESK